MEWRGCPQNNVRKSRAHFSHKPMIVINPPGLYNNSDNNSNNDYDDVGGGTGGGDCVSTKMSSMSTRSRIEMSLLTFLFCDFFFSIRVDNSNLITVETHKFPQSILYNSPFILHLTDLSYR